MKTSPAPAFEAVVGTGGVGSGIIYRLVGNHDLGRNESRMAHRVPQRDFCKLHIVLHYVSALARDLGLHLPSYPVSAVGDDEVGRELLRDMQAAGMDLRHMQTLGGTGTLFAVCYQFPDHTGGNITEADNACDKVTPAVISSVFPLLRKHRNRCLILAAPEVPLRARAALLKEARHHGAFTAASFVSGEMETVRRGALLKLVDLLAVNIDEAAVLGNVRHREKAADIVEACVASIRKLNPGLSLTITNGGAGAWAWHDGTLRHLPSLKVPVVNAAGAGDAWLAGLMLGLIRGLPFAAAGKTATCMRLARLVSAMSVLSADTIHFGITLKSLAAFGRKHGESDLVRRLLQG